MSTGHPWREPSHHPAARTILAVRVAAAVALAALVLSGCSKVIDESQIPVVTVPDTGTTPQL